MLVNTGQVVIYCHIHSQHLAGLISGSHASIDFHDVCPLWKEAGIILAACCLNPFPSALVSDTGTQQSSWGLPPPSWGSLAFLLC